MTGTFPLPSEPSNEVVQLKYGLTADVSKIGRMCTVYINSSVNRATTAWENLGYLPRPKTRVLAPNCAGMDHYALVNPEGQLVLSKALSSGGYIQSYFCYLLADDE